MVTGLCTEVPSLAPRCTLPGKVQECFVFMVRQLGMETLISYSSACGLNPIKCNLLQWLCYGTKIPKHIPLMPGNIAPPSNYTPTQTTGNQPEIGCIYKHLYVCVESI